MVVLRPENIIWRNRSWRTGKYIPDHDTHAHVEHHDQKILISIGRWIETQRYGSIAARVSQHEAFGGVDRVHSATSLHYAKPSEALDVNLGYGNPAGETAFLDRIMAQLWAGQVTTDTGWTPPPPPPPPPRRGFLSDLSAAEQRELYNAVCGHDPKDPGMVHRIKNTIQPKVVALDDAFLRQDQNDPGLLHILKNDTVKQIRALYRKFVPPT